MALTKAQFQELLAKAKKDKNERKIEEMKAKVATAPEYPFAPKMPEVPKVKTPKELLEEIKARQAAKKLASQQEVTQPVSAPVEPEVKQLEVSSETLDKYGNSITYNEQQQKFVSVGASSKNCVLIGAAGTGKTTCIQGTMRELILSGKIPVLQSEGHAHLVDGTPGIIIISYTRRAVNNIRKILPDDLKNNCITAHKLLEFAPVFYEVEDDQGRVKKTMSFEPSRNSVNPLPSTIHTIVIEESSMLSLELFKQISDALQHPVQWIFLGDLNQLPPVFGPAILGFKMLEYTTVELNQVYRQALESPIIKLAHQILSGVPIPAENYPDWKVENKLTIHPWKKKLHADLAVLTLAAFFKKAIDTGIYDVDNDVILTPHNKGCGTIELNKHIANHLARTRNAVTYEVIAGFNKHYFSVGDKVLYEKEDAEIVGIKKNPAYTGEKYQPSSPNLDYWGHNPNLVNESDDEDYAGIDDVDFLLAQAASTEERVTQCSHVISVKLVDSGLVLDIDKAAQVNQMLHSYSLTVHKAQGSEWRKVFLAFHQSHAAMLQRELLYTAVTRAREELYIICEPETFTKGILSQKIKGNSLEEKAEYFKGKLSKAGVTLTNEEDEE